ncbi:MAG: DUF4399 domain-containing protein [Gammaproteobacteria bacterium]|nr:DUF4399 domain-containing protein [Gammaproteobacteria bacterium]
MSRRPYILLITILTLLLTACGGSDQPAETGSETNMPGSNASAPGATVFIITPMNGDSVSSPVNVKFGISGINVAPAGTYTDNTGHHHLIIDTQLQDYTQPVPSDTNHLHFGKGQTEAAIELAPGEHSLQLVLGDGNHIPHDPPVVSEIVTITVE